MICKKCEKIFHYCCSCDTEECCENGYCSDKCYKSSDEFKKIKEDLINFYKSLSPQQYDYIVENFEYVSSDILGFEFEKWGNKRCAIKL